MYSDNWIWNQTDWPKLRWQEELFSATLKQLYFQAGQIYSLCNTLSDSDNIKLLVHQLLCSEEKHPRSYQQQLLTSLRQHHGLPISAAASMSGHSNALARAITDSTCNTKETFSLERIIKWHQAIDKSEESHLRQGKEGDGTKQVLFEIINLVEWFNTTTPYQCDPLIKTAIAYLRLACVKPFDEHNTHVCRMFANLALNQSFDIKLPLYLDPNVLNDKSEHYKFHLDDARRSGTDISEWIDYFLNAINQSLKSTISMLSKIQRQPEYWSKVADSGLNTSQINALKELFSSMNPNASISAAEYQKLTGVSKASATRHLAEMQEKGCISRLGAGGRSTRYRLNLDQYLSL